MGYVQTINCYLCGIEFGMDNDLYQQRLKDHRDFYCPNGHAQRFLGKNKWEKRIDELEDLVARLERDNRYAYQQQRELEDEWTTCPFDNCFGRNYHYINRDTWMRHMADRHGVRLIERKALPAAGETA